MSATSRPRGEFALELQRAAVRRGGLEELFKGLSDHWTLTLQRLYPVWVVVGPGLSTPAHIELASRTVYLDSEELLGPKAELRSGRIDRRRVLVCFGAAIHETLHAKHTKPWIAERDRELHDAGELVLFEDRRLLEEPRMEATGVREFAELSTRGRFVRRALAAAVCEVIVPRFAAQLATGMLAGAPVGRDLCGRAMTYLRARTHYGVLDAASLAPLQPIWRRTLGDQDMGALDDLYARLIWAPDGDNDALDRFAREYREIIGPPDEPREPDEASADGAGQGDGDQQQSEGTGERADADDTPGRSRSARGRTVKSLGDALAEAQQLECESQLQQLDEDVTLADVLAEASGASDPGDQRQGGGTGRPSGRMPDRGVDRPAYPDEAQAAIRLANQLARARTQATKRIEKRTPGGRFVARNHVRGQAQLQMGQPQTTHPWSIERRTRNPIQEPHVALVLDTSGSMGGYEYALGPIVWIVDRALRQVGGRLAVCLFGNGVELLSDGRRPLGQVPGIRTGGGTAFAGDAILEACRPLEMDNRRRPRLLFCVSDGGWYDTGAGVQKIRELAEHGVPTIHISIGSEPLSVEAERVAVIRDPADALDEVARETVQAIQQASGRR